MVLPFSIDLVPCVLMTRRKAKRQRCEPLDRYIELHGITAAELAKKIDLGESLTRSLVNGNRRVLAEYAVRIEQKIGIPRETLRPDLFVKRAA